MYNILGEMKYVSIVLCKQWVTSLFGLVFRSVFCWDQTSD